MNFGSRSVPSTLVESNRGSGLFSQLKLSGSEVNSARVRAGAYQQAKTVALIEGFLPLEFGRATPPLHPENFLSDSDSRMLRTYLNGYLKSLKIQRGEVGDVLALLKLPESKVAQLVGEQKRLVTAASVTRFTQEDFFRAEKIVKKATNNAKLWEKEPLKTSLPTHLRILATSLLTIIAQRKSCSLASLPMRMQEQICPIDNFPNPKERKQLVQGVLAVGGIRKSDDGYQVTPELELTMRNLLYRLTQAGGRSSANQILGRLAPGVSFYSHITVRREAAQKITDEAVAQLCHLVRNSGLVR